MTSSGLVELLGLVCSNELVLCNSEDTNEARLLGALFFFLILKGQITVIHVEGFWDRSGTNPEDRIFTTQREEGIFALLFCF